MSKPKESSNTIRGLYKRGDVWYSRIADVNGRLVRKRLSADKGIAITILTEMRKVKELQRAGVLPDNAEPEIKLSRQLRDMYLTRLQSLGRSQATIRAFLQSWKYLVEDNKLDHIDEITVARALEFADKLKAKGTRGQTINQYVELVKDALDWARDFEHIKKSPLARWEGVKKDSPRKRRDFTSDEVRRFLAAEDNGITRLRWLIYFHTGLRATAGSVIEWEWIDWSKREIILPARANKSGTDHSIPMSNELYEALLSRKQALPEGSATGLIFQTVALHQLRRRFIKICEKAGIDCKGLCLHSIRHTYATGAFEASGHNVKVVQELLCHASASTTMKYIHVSDSQKRVVAEALGARMGHDIAELSKDGLIIKLPAAHHASTDISEPASLNK